MCGKRRIESGWRRPYPCAIHRIFEDHDMFGKARLRVSMHTQNRNRPRAVADWKRHRASKSLKKKIAIVIVLKNAIGVRCTTQVQSSISGPVLHLRSSSATQVQVYISGPSSYLRSRFTPQVQVHRSRFTPQVQVHTSGPSSPLRSRFTPQVQVHTSGPGSHLRSKVTQQVQIHALGAGSRPSS